MLSHIWHRYKFCCNCNTTNPAVLILPTLGDLKWGGKAKCCFPLVPGHNEAKNTRPSIQTKPGDEYKDWLMMDDVLAAKVPPPPLLLMLKLYSPHRTIGNASKHGTMGMSNALTKPIPDVFSSPFFILYLKQPKKEFIQILMWWTRTHYCKNHRSTSPGSLQLYLFDETLKCISEQWGCS